MCPEKKEMIIKGIASDKPINPRASLSCVISYICQLTITLCIWIASVRKNLVFKKNKNSFIRKAANGSCFEMAGCIVVCFANL